MTSLPSPEGIDFRDVMVGCDFWNSGKMVGDPLAHWWSELLRPHCSLDQVLDVGASSDMEKHVLSVVDGMTKAVSQVVEARHRIISGRFDSGRKLGPGRVLLFAPLMSLNDGLAGDLTAGFFDVHNCPAWDTWVAFIDTIDREVSGLATRCHLWESCLVAFIPECSVAAVDQGVSANVEGCVAWADTLPATNRLRRMIEGATR